MNQYRLLLKSRLWLFATCIFFPIALHGMDDFVNNWYDREVEALDKLTQKVTYQPVKRWLDWGIIKLYENRPSGWVQVAQRAGIGEDRLEKLRWYNTLLTSDKSLIGLYKGDFVDAALTVGDLTVDSLMRKMLLTKRIDTILESMVSDSTELLLILDHIEEAVAAHDQNYWATFLKTLRFPNPRVRIAQANPLINYIQEKHRYFGKLPFTSSTILPMLARWFYYKGSNAIARRFSPSLQDGAALLPLGVYNVTSYKKDKHGKVSYSNAWPGFPIAPVRWLTAGLRWWYDPFKPTGVREVLDRKVIDAKLGVARLPIPSIFTSGAAFQAYDFLGLCFGAKIFDELYMQRWIHYVIKHRAQLRLLLKTYDSTVRLSDERKEAREALKKFIEKGHRDKGTLPGSMVGAWWQAIRGGHTVVPAWINLAVTGTLIARGLLVYLALTKKTA